MNKFLASVKAALLRNGALGTYTKYSASVYNIETSSNTSTTTDYQIQMYEKNISTSQYNFPNLIGKQVSMFYIAADSIPFVPQIKDVITFNGTKFAVDSFTEHMASGQVVMYKVIAVRN